MDYNGSDLIICMGAPGSRWSGSIRAIQTCTDINTSDDHEDRLYDLTDIDKNDKMLGWHRGCYWGPFHEFGKNFDRLDTLTKEQVIEEFQKPFENFAPGKKIIKSHWFSYHIPLLREWFPEARLVAFYMDDDFCYDWWHRVGGWKITYPHYDWYENDERMASQIAIENAHIREHFELKNYSLNELQLAVGLSAELRPEQELYEWDPKIKIMSKQLDKHYLDMLNTTVNRTLTGVI